MSEVQKQIDIAQYFLEKNLNKKADPENPENEINEVVTGILDDLANDKLNDQITTWLSAGTVK